MECWKVCWRDTNNHLQLKIWCIYTRYCKIQIEWYIDIEKILPIIFEILISRMSLSDPNIFKSTVLKRVWIHVWTANYSRRIWSYKRSVDSHAHRIYYNLQKETAWPLRSTHGQMVIIQPHWKICGLACIVLNIFENPIILTHDSERLWNQTSTIIIGITQVQRTWIANNHK